MISNAAGGTAVSRLGMNRNCDYHFQTPFRYFAELRERAPGRELNPGALGRKRGSQLRGLDGLGGEEPGLRDSKKEKETLASEIGPQYSLWYPEVGGVMRLRPS